MGTRVDFYVGRGETAEWLGSYPFDGYPDGVFGDVRDNQEVFGPIERGEPVAEGAWRSLVAGFLTENADRATLPEQGWPWPWETSATTDYAYAWDDGVIYGSCFGHRWFTVNPDAKNWGEDDDERSDKSAVFPDMTARKAVTYGPRSGLIVFGLPSS